MKDKIFLDTNIIIYAFSNDTNKKQISKQFLKKSPIISIQVINETLSVGYKKLKLSHNEIMEIFIFLNKSCTIVNIETQTIELAINLKENYKFSYWDSLIIASALENDCKHLYSEDLQHDQIIQNRIKIVNPFL